MTLSTWHFYVGKNYLEVKGTLVARGLVVNIEEEAVDSESNFENDQIVRQSVEVGASLTKGENITLYVAKVGIAYPDFTDGSYTVADVEEFCKDNNITLKITYTVSDTNLDGTIYEQSRAAGTPAKSGATFIIKVYKNEEPDTEEPDEGNNCEDGLC